RVSGPRRAVAADGLLPRLARRPGARPGPGRGRGEAHRHGPADDQDAAVRRRSQTGDPAQAQAGDCRRRHEGRWSDHLRRHRPARRPVRGRGAACSSLRHVARPRGAARAGVASAERERVGAVRQGEGVSMRRVVVTGMGIVSSIGNNTQEVLASLREAKSGIVRAEEYAKLGFRCQVHGAPRIEWEGMVPRKARRFMEAGVGWNYVAMDQAIRDAGLEQREVEHERTGIIMGSGGPSTRAIVRAADVAREKDPKKVGPFEVPKGMCSGPSAALATAFQIKGVNYSISSACATSAHCIGNAAELIQWGKQDVMFAGGCEELDWTLSVLFDAMGAMSTKYNATPSKASRAYDKNRDGFVIAGGAGVVTLEELEHAKARGAKIYGEIVGY